MGWKGALIEPLVGLAALPGPHGPPPEQKVPREILVLRLSDFGDLLTTTPIYEALRKRFPMSKIVAAVGAWGRPLLQNNPYIDEIVVLNAPWKNKFVKDQSLGAVLKFLLSSAEVEALRRRGGFDLGIDIVGSHTGAMLMLRLGVRHRIGVRGYGGGWSACHRYIEFSNQVHVAQAALAQAKLLGCANLPDARPQLFVTGEERADAERLWGRDGRSLRLLVGCGAGLEEKTWSPGPAGIALKEFAKRLDPGFGTPNILLIGGAEDRKRAAKIMEADVPGMRSLCGETSLRETFALTEKANVVLTNSSMLCHVAASFRRPTVVILGPAHPSPTDHDALWGYPPPYVSIGPSTSDNWPTPESVAALLLSTVERYVSAAASS